MSHPTTSMSRCCARKSQRSPATGWLVAAAQIKVRNLRPWSFLLEKGGLSAPSRSTHSHLLGWPSRPTTCRLIVPGTCVVTRPLGNYTANAVCAPWRTHAASFYANDTTIFSTLDGYFFYKAFDDLRWVGQIFLVSTGRIHVRT